MANDQNYPPKKLEFLVGLSGTWVRNLGRLPWASAYSSLILSTE